MKNLWLLFFPGSGGSRSWKNPGSDPQPCPLLCRRYPRSYTIEICSFISCVLASSIKENWDIKIYLSRLCVFTDGLNFYSSMPFKYALCRQFFKSNITKCTSKRLQLHWKQFINKFIPSYNVYDNIRFTKARSLSNIF